MNVLGLDIGERRTGVAFGDSLTGVPVALDTLHHRSVEDLLLLVKGIISDKDIQRIVCGLPRLPSGEEGEQCAFVRDVIAELDDGSIPIELLDERYTTPRQSDIDPDASAAVQLLLTYFERLM